MWGESYCLGEYFASTYSILQELLPPTNQVREDFLKGQNGNLWIANLNPPQERFKQAFQAFFLTLYQDTHGKANWGWKEVRYGQAELEFFWEIFPGLKLVLLVRNPRDVLISRRALGWRMEFSKSTATVEEVCENWARKTGYYLKIKKDPRVFFVRYEEVRDCLPALCRFVDGEYTQAVQEVANTVIMAAPNENKQPLSDEDKAALQRVCGPLMEELGYAVEGGN
jgi:hypothetical protein